MKHLVINVSILIKMIYSYIHIGATHYIYKDTIDENYVGFEATAHARAAFSDRSFDFVL